MTSKKLSALIRSCRANNRDARDMILDSFFDYAKGVCSQYTRAGDRLNELINSGFLFVFKNIHRVNVDSNDVDGEFKELIRKMMICSIVWHDRKNDRLKDFVYSREFGLDVVKDMALSHRLVLYLSRIEGFSEGELAQCLNVSVPVARILLIDAGNVVGQLGLPVPKLSRTIETCYPGWRPQETV